MRALEDPGRWRALAAGCFPRAAGLAWESRPCQGEEREEDWEFASDGQLAGKARRVLDDLDDASIASSRSVW
jgi:hypothetical protein